MGPTPSTLPAPDSDPEAGQSLTAAAAAAAAAAGAAAAMQTPSITAGKTVVRGKTNDRGTVLSVNPGAGTATVRWSESASRLRPVSLANLFVPPIPNPADVRLPTADGQRVLINSGQHAHKYGTITSFNRCAGGSGMPHGLLPGWAGLGSNMPLGLLLPGGTVLHFPSSCLLFPRHCHVISTRD